MGANLNQDEVDSLMNAIEDGRVGSDETKGSQKQVVPYDLTSQDRVIRGQMPTLDAINEQVASAFGMGIAGRTRLTLRVSSAPATLLKFVDFNSMLAPPATVCVLSLGKGSGEAIIVLEPGLADALMAAALGDRKAKADETPGEVRRDLTSVERQVLKRLLTIFTDAMAIAWKPVIAFHPEVMRFEPDPRLAAIAPPNESAILCSFELTGGITGRLQLAIPFAAVEPAKKALSAAPRMHTTNDSRYINTISAELSQVAIEIRVALGKVTLPLARVVDLQVGDVVTLPTSESALLPVLVEGRQKLSGRPTVSSGALAITVEEACDRFSGNGSLPAVSSNAPTH